MTDVKFHTSLDYTFLKYHSRGEVGFNAYCNDNNGEVVFTPGSSRSTCRVQVNTLERLPDWCSKYGGTYHQLGPDFVNQIDNNNSCKVPLDTSDNFNRALFQRDYKSQAGFERWCGLWNGRISYGPNNAYTDCRITTDQYQASYRYVPGQTTIATTEYDEESSSTNTDRKTARIPYEVIDNPSETVFVHPGLNEQTDTEAYAEYIYYGKGEDEAIVNTIVYPSYTSIDDNRRKAYFCSNTNEEPEWGRYASPVYTDEHPAGYDYEIVNLSPYQITVWTSTDGGRRWNRLNKIETSGQPGAEPIVLRTSDKKTLIRYGASNATSKGETIDDFLPSGKAVNIEFRLKVGGNVEDGNQLGRRAHHSPSVFVQSKWNEYNSVYTDQLESDCTYKLWFNPSKLPKDQNGDAVAPYVNVWGSTTGQGNWAYITTMGPKEDFINVPSAGKPLKVESQFPLSTTIRDDGVRRGFQYYRYTIAEETGGQTVNYFKPDGLTVVGLELEKVISDAALSPSRYYYSPAKNTKTKSIRL